MSILDGLCEDATLAADKLLGPIGDAALGAMALSEREKALLRLIRAGQPLAAALKLPPGFLEGLLVRGGDLIRCGMVEAGREVLTLLVMLWPLDPRGLYALGLAHQISGQIEAAAKIYLLFVARDATNPDGYLRLGECLLCAREYDKAEACFLAASRLSAEGRGSAASRDHAARMSAYLAHILAEKAQ